MDFLTGAGSATRTQSSSREALTTRLICVNFSKFGLDGYYYRNGTVTETRMTVVNWALGKLHSALLDAHRGGNRQKRPTLRGNATVVMILYWYLRAPFPADEPLLEN